MTEKQLIAKIKELRQIKPRKDWVILTKRQILGKERPGLASFFIPAIKREIEFTFRHKPAFAVVTVILVLIGVFGFAQNSLPGDILYSVKRIAEKSRAIFVSESEQLEFDIGIANKRLDELTKIAQSNSVKNLEPAINEYQASVSEVAKNLAKEEDKETVKKIVNEVKKLEEKEKQVRSLGTVIGENEELDRAYAQKMIEALEAFIKDLESRSLTEEQNKVLDEVRKDWEGRNYSQALEKILKLD